MRKTIALIFSLLLLLAVACSGPTNRSDVTTSLPETKTPPPAKTEEMPIPETETGENNVQIGRISLERDMVEHGLLGGTLEQLVGTDPLFDGDSLRLFQGGESILDFGDSMQLRLFNDTELDDIRRTTPEGTPLGVQLYLALGGFTGRVTEEGSQATVRTPGGATVKVFGTDFFVTYDNDSEQTTVGNFIGSVEVNSGGVDINVEEGFFVVVPANEPPGPPKLLATGFEQFEEMARDLNSPLAASQEVGEWSLSIEYLHEFIPGESDVILYDTKGYSSKVGPPENSLVTWSGIFAVEDGNIDGEGEGEIEGKFVCPLLAGVDGELKTLFEFYEIHGTFKFNIGGTLTAIQGEPVLFLSLEGDNFSLTTTADQINHENAKFCTGKFRLHDYFENLALNPNSMTGIIELAASDGASITISDIEPPSYGTTVIATAQLEVEVTQASRVP